MTMAGLTALRMRLGCADGGPVIAVPVEDEGEAEQVRRAGGLPLDRAGRDLDGVDVVAVGSLGYGDNGGTPGDRTRVYELERRGAVAVVSGGLNAIRLLGFFENLGHADVVVVARRGVAGHIDGIGAGVRSLRLAARCRREGGAVFAFAGANPAFGRAFFSFSEDADALYPGWRDAPFFRAEGPGDN